MIKLILRKLFILYLILFTIGCDTVRESAGVNRSVPDEYTVTNDPPLAIPPDYNLLPSEDIIKQKKLTSDSEITKEILFGLDEELNEIETNNTSTALSSILKKSGADESNASIRKELEEYEKTKSSINIFGGEKYMTKEEVLDAAGESQRLRENIFNKKDLLEGDTPITLRPKKRKTLFSFN